jgi:hypothetical protein
MKGGFFMENWITLITNTGFPIAVASYLLIRFETKIDGLSKAISDLSHVVDKNLNFKGDDKAA